MRCGVCRAVIAEPLTLCPRCRFINEKGAAECARCATDLSVKCPGCGRINGSGSDRCGGCGIELDVLGHAFRHFDRSVQARREDLIRRVPGLRENEERESLQRLDMLRETDRRRLEREAERAVQAKLRERRIIIGTGVGILVFLILVLLAAVIFL